MRAIGFGLLLILGLLATACGGSSSSTESDAVQDQLTPDVVVSDTVVPDAADAGDLVADNTTEDTTAKDSSTEDATTDDTAADASHKPSWLDNTTADLPQKLSEVGIYPDMTDRTKVDSRLVFYQPRFPLWTDGALKTRYLFLPKGTRIDNTDREKWVFPDGAVLFKHFEFPGQPVETRVLRKKDGTWKPVAYQWNAEGTEATLLDGSDPIAVPITGQTDLQYFIPNELQCEMCHTTNDTWIIGFDELRLNHKVDAYPKKQIEQFADLALFKDPLPQTLEEIQETRPEALKAKGYLHGNCAHCHNEVAKFSTLNLRHNKIDESVINKPTDGPGTKPGTRVVPKDPDNSTLFIATISWNSVIGIKNMPFIGVSKIDPSLEQILKDWINAL